MEIFSNRILEKFLGKSIVAIYFPYENSQPQSFGEIQYYMNGFDLVVQLDNFFIKIEHAKSLFFEFEFPEEGMESSEEIIRVLDCEVLESFNDEGYHRYEELPLVVSKITVFGRRISLLDYEIKILEKYNVEFDSYVEEAIIFESEDGTMFIFVYNDFFPFPYLVFTHRKIFRSLADYSEKPVEWSSTLYART